MTGFVTCLWFDGVAEDAAHFEVSVLPDGKLGRIVRNPEGGPAAGPVRCWPWTSRSTASGSSASFHGLCTDEVEMDFYWIGTERGRHPERVRVAHRPLRVSWPTVPVALMEMAADPDARKTARVRQALRTMGKLDLDALRAAYRGERSGGDFCRRPDKTPGERDSGRPIVTTRPPSVAFHFDSVTLPGHRSPLPQLADR